MVIQEKVRRNLLKMIHDMTLTGRSRSQGPGTQDHNYSRSLSPTCLESWQERNTKLTKTSSQSRYRQTGICCDTANSNCSFGGHSRLAAFPPAAEATDKRPLVVGISLSVIELPLARGTRRRVARYMQ